MKIHIQKPYVNGHGKARIFIIDETPTRRFSIQLGKDGLLTQTLLLDDGAEITPFVELPSQFFDEFVKAIVNYAIDNNIKTENESVLQGKFTATEKHLEDLRRIVFKDFPKS